MTIFIDQKELIDMFRRKLNISKNSKVQINIKVGMKENESIWINSDGTYNTNIKGE
jgi:hypothetical protein